MQPHAGRQDSTADELKFKHISKSCTVNGNAWRLHHETRQNHYARKWVVRKEDLPYTTQAVDYKRQHPLDLKPYASVISYGIAL